MLGYLKDLPLRVLANVLVGFVLVAGLVVGAASYATYREVDGIRTTWESLARGPFKKTVDLSNLSAALGLGAMIHDFKNLVLRGDKSLVPRLEEEVAAAREAIEAYRALGVNTAESEALRDVAGVVEQFATKVPQAVKMIDAGASATEIDRAVIVDQSPAVRGFERLHKQLAEARDASQRAVFDAVAAGLFSTKVGVGAVALLAAVLVIVFRWFARNRFVTPLGTLVRFVDRVGNGDLTHQTDQVGRDEVGTLGRNLNAMVASLKDITLQTRQAVGNLSSLAAETMASTKQQSASVEEQFATVQETTATLEEIAQSGAQMSGRAQEVAGAAEHASMTSEEGLRAVDDMSRSMDSIRDQAEAVAENIVALSEKTQAIGEIITSVNDIAERSHLLALNAAIEAAAAGEQGRSFSVVAEEIKTLADQAKGATVQVRAILGDIQHGINTSVMLTEESVKRVASGRQQAETTQNTIRELATNIQDSVQAFEQIVAATNQQSIGLNQVSEAIRQIRQSSEQTASGTRQIEQAVVGINSLGDQLTRAMERYAV